MMKFDGKVLIIGFGAVARCTLPILLKHVDIPLNNITVIDFENRPPLYGDGSAGASNIAI